MWQRFTERARRVVLFAQEEAEKMNSGHVGTEHLLLGLLRDTKGGASQVLRERGVLLEAVRSLLPESGSVASTEELKLTPKAKRTLELSADESRLMRHKHIGTEHLLIALTRDCDTSAAKILKRFNLDVETLRVCVVESFSHRNDLPDELETIPPEVASTTILPTYGEPEPVRITGRTFKVLQLAQNEARKAGSWVETHHVLLGLLAENEGVASHVLPQVGVTLKAVRSAIDELIAQGELSLPVVLTNEKKAVFEPKLAPQTERTLDLAADKARYWRHNFISPEHVLFVLAKYPKGHTTSSKVLRHLNVDLNLLCEQISFFVSPESTNIFQQISSQVDDSENDDTEEETEEPLPPVEKAVSPLTPQYRQVLERARELAGKRYSFGVPELLLAALERSDSVEVQLLIECGLDLETARQRLEAQLNREDKHEA